MQANPPKPLPESNSISVVVLAVLSGKCKGLLVLFCSVWELSDQCDHAGPDIASHKIYLFYLYGCLADAAARILKSLSSLQFVATGPSAHLQT